MREFRDQLIDYQLLNSTLLHRTSNIVEAEVYSDLHHCTILISITLKHTIIISCIYLFICGLFHDAVSSSDYIGPNNRTTNERWIIKDVEGSGCGSAMPAFGWGTEEITKTSVKTAGFRAEIWTRDLENRKQEFWPHSTVTLSSLSRKTNTRTYPPLPASLSQIQWDWLGLIVFVVTAGTLINNLTIPNGQIMAVVNEKREADI
jgi:hypothetical protein